MRASVHVPKTAMDVDDFAQPWQHDVGRAGEIATMKAEAMAEAVDQATNNRLGLGSLLFENLNHIVPVLVA